MSTERLGSVWNIDIGSVKLEVAMVFPDQDENSSPSRFHVTVWSRQVQTTMSREEVTKLLAAFGGAPQYW